MDSFIIFSMKKIGVVSIIFFSTLTILFVSVNHTFAQSAKDTGYGLNEVASGKLQVGATPSETIGKVLGGVLSFVSVIFFLLTLYGGIMWMTSRGNEQQADKALNTVLSASIGLVIVLSSYVIVNFLFSTIKG